MAKPSKPNFNLRSILLVLIPVVGFLGTDYFIYELTNSFVITIWSLSYSFGLFGIVIIATQIGTWAKSLIEKLKRPTKFNQLLILVTLTTILGVSLPILAAYFTVGILGEERALDLSLVSTYVAFIFVGIGLLAVFIKQLDKIGGWPYLILILSMIGGLGYFAIHFIELFLSGPTLSLFILFSSIEVSFSINQDTGYGAREKKLREQKQFKKLYSLKTLFLFLAIFISISLAQVTNAFIPEESQENLTYGVFGLAIFILIVGTARYVKNRLKNKSS
ncbi:MAG: hypothetical protein V3R20_04385 [Sphingomonadales bacterium]